MKKEKKKKEDVFSIQQVADLHKDISYDVIYEQARAGKLSIITKKQGKKTMYFFHGDLVRRSLIDGFKVLKLDYEGLMLPRELPRKEVVQDLGEIPGSGKNVVSNY